LQLYFVLKGEIQLYISDGKNIRSLGFKKVVRRKNIYELNFK